MSRKKEERWSAYQAVEEALKVGVFLSLPTLYKMCREQNVGYQVPPVKGGNWYVYPDKFMKIILGKKK